MRVTRRLLFAPAFALACAAHAQTLPPVTADPPSALAPIAGTPSIPAAATGVTPSKKPLRQSPEVSLSGPVDISRAISLALALSPRIARANAGLQNALGQLGEAQALRLPTFGANTGNRTYSPGVNEYVDEKLRHSDVTDIPTFGFTATLPIDVAGDLRAASDQAHFNAVAAEIDVTRARNDVLAQVAGAFYDVLRSQALVAVAQDNLADSQTRLTDAEEKFKTRVVAILDVERSQTDVEDAREQLIVARSNVAISLSALNDAIGLDVDTPLVLTDNGAVVAPAIPPPSSVNEQAPYPPTPIPPQGGIGEQSGGQAATDGGNVPSLLPSTAGSTVDPLQNDPEYRAMADEAIRTRPEILEGDAEIEAARRGIAYARRSILPSVQVGVKYDYAPVTSGTSVLLNNTQTFIGVVLPLYDAGQARARQNEAEARETDAIVARRQAVDFATLDVRQSYLTLQQARQRVAVAGQAVAEAKDAYSIAQVRYKAGVTSTAGLSPLLELSDAETALVAAETQQVNALFDYNRARVNLNHAIGRYAAGEPAHAR